VIFFASCETSDSDSCSNQFTNHTSCAILNLWMENMVLQILFMIVAVMVESEDQDSRPIMEVTVSDRSQLSMF